MPVTITNITDAVTPARAEAISHPKTVTVFNTDIAPGNHVLFDDAIVYPNGILSRHLIGPIDAGLICIGKPPDWYLKASKASPYPTLTAWKFGVKVKQDKTLPIVAARKKRMERSKPVPANVVTQDRDTTDLVAWLNAIPYADFNRLAIGMKLDGGKRKTVTDRIAMAYAKGADIAGFPPAVTG